MYKIEVYIPHSHLEEVKEAMFSAGAGKMGDYDCCCWQIEGSGQFRPCEGSSPFIGEKDKIERVKEWKVELVCDAQYMKETIKALFEAHPYEEPAYNIVKILDRSDFLN